MKAFSLCLLLNAILPAAQEEVEKERLAYFLIFSELLEINLNQNNTFISASPSLVSDSVISV